MSEEKKEQELTETSEQPKASEEAAKSEAQETNDSATEISTGETVMNEAEAASEPVPVEESKAEGQPADNVRTANMEKTEEAGDKEQAPSTAASTTDPGDASEDAEKEAKRKAAAEARAARAAAKAEASESAEGGAEGEDADAEKEAKKKAAAEARAARAAARAKTEEEASAPKEPSPKQPVLDRFVEILKQNVGEKAVEEAYINEPDRHLPTVIVRNEDWLKAAMVLKDHPELKLHYLRNVAGVDRETHFEMVYHLVNFEAKQDYCVKVKIDREKPNVPSLAPLWSTANWHEREAYDLLGIVFVGHPNLTRIMMPDDWVGHPLRKDYEPIDPEV